jgi:hypothetical protein
MMQQHEQQSQGAMQDAGSTSHWLVLKFFKKIEIENLNDKPWSKAGVRSNLGRGSSL